MQPDLPDLSTGYPSPWTDSAVSVPGGHAPIHSAGSREPVNAAAGIVNPGSLPARPSTLSVLHLINGEHFSGAERVQDLLALHLPAMGYEVTFACLKPGKFASARQSQDTALVEMGMTSRRSIGVAWRLASLVRHSDIRILHSHTPRTALIGSIVARLTGRPLVHHVHSPTSRDSTRRLQNFANSWVERICMQTAHMLIPVSQSLANWLTGLGVPSSRIQVVPNGVPSPRLTRGPVAPRGTWVLGIVALFRPRKGLEVLLQALAELRLANVDVRVRAVGPFECDAYERTIQGLVQQLRIGPAIDWIGFTSETAAEFAKMDLLILPSLFGEGLPMVLLEAMAAGVPTIATKVEGVPEAIRADVDGVLVPPHDPAALAHAIRRILAGELDWQTLRKNAMSRHAERFSADAMARQVARIYDQVLMTRQTAGDPQASTRRS